MIMRQLIIKVFIYQKLNLARTALGCIHGTSYLKINEGIIVKQVKCDPIEPIVTQQFFVLIFVH